MSTFQTFDDLTVADRTEYERIDAMDANKRNATEQEFLDNRSAYVDNEIVLLDADDNILIAKGNTVPTGFAEFSKSALFIKKDVASGTKALYENVGDTVLTVFNLIGDISESEIGTDAVTTPKIKDGAVTAPKLAAALDLDGKNISLPSGTPVNAVGSVGTLNINGDVVEGEIITIGGRVYEIDSDGSIDPSSDVAIDVSGGAVAATGILTFNGVVIDGETVLIGGRVYEFDTDSSITGDVQIDISGGTKAQATVALTISGVVIEGETVTIGSEVYEFDADGSVGGGNIAVDISASMTASQGTLTLGGAIPSNNEDVTVNSQVYTWKSTLTGAADELKIGITVDDCIDAFTAAINAGVGEGTLYGNGTVANAAVTAEKTGATTSKLTAIVFGVIGDLVDTTDGMGDGANIFDDTTLGTTTAGVDCSANNAVTAIVADFVGTDITASDAGGGVCDFDADAAGVQDGSVGNAVTTTEAMANGALGAGTLTGGSDATQSEAVTAVAAAITGDGSATVTGVDGTGDTVDLTAIEEGTVGNAITTTETCANGSFGTGTLTSGSDEGAANAVTAIALAITNDGSAEVSAVDGAGDTVVVTALVLGVSGDAIVSTTDLSNGVWDAIVLENGVDGTVGVLREVLVDTSYLYSCIATNTIADANWRRVALGSAY